MARRSRVGASRTFVGLTGMAILGVLALGATAIIAAPAATPPGNGTERLASQAPAGGDPVMRLLQWSGRTWVVYPNGANGPENVAVTNSPRAVWVDSQGNLHLKIVKIGGAWRSVELQSLYPVTYGTYRLINDTATARFAPTTILGMFVYRPHSQNYTNEIDIENSRFPKHLRAPNNAQFAIQPYWAPNHYHGYAVAPSYKPLLQQFTWYPAPSSGGNGTVEFETRIGSTPHAPLLSSWTYHGYSVPTAQSMYLYLNLWLNKGMPPVGGTHSAVLRSVTFTPLGD